MGNVLNLLTIAGTALLAGRMVLTGLHQRYRAFFVFLLFETARDIAMAPLSNAGSAYQIVWVLTEPLEWLLYALVVLEIYALVLNDYRGLFTAGRWCLMAALSIAVAAAGLTLLAPSHYSRQSQLMAYYYVAERAVYFSLAVFLLAILALLMRFPITLSRNIISHSLIFSIYFLVGTFLYGLLSASGYGVIGIVSYSLTAVNVTALCGWLILLNRAGEQRKQQLRPAWMPGQEEQLVRQLNSLNCALQALIG